jgi:hypothetical protein
MSDSTETTASLPPTADNDTQNESAPQSLWSSIREALRGSHRDYTQGLIGRSILLLAIPMVLEMLMESDSRKRNCRSAFHGQRDLSRRR